MQWPCNPSGEYTVFCSRDNRYFFSTCHMQFYDDRSKFSKKDFADWCPCSFSLPMAVVPRPSLPSGIVRTIQEYVMIFHNDEQEIDNPDSLFEPKWHRQARVSFESEQKGL